MTTLLEMAQYLKEGRITATELVERALAAAARSEHVFISLLEHRARSAAQASDQRWRDGTPLSPLDGIPYGVKDLVDVAGSRTTAGSPSRAGIPLAQEDAQVIATLSRMGMIPLGKTNLSEFAYSGLGLNPYFGTPVADFPALEARAPGGSSSGSAIAVQRGVVSVALGTDTAGSIRVPAAFNGLVGFKATTGRYAMQGVHPLAATLDSLGPLAHSVADCVAFDAAMLGRSELTLPATPPTQLRLVVDSSVMADAQLQPAVRDNLLAAMERLRAAGVEVEQRPLLSVARTRALIADVGWLGAIEAWRLLGAIVEGPDGPAMDPRVRKRLRAARQLSTDSEARIRRVRLELMGAMAQELNGALLVLPTVLHVAPALAALERDDELFAAVNLNTLSLTMIGSLLDMPGVAIPSGTDPQGLPTSLLFSLPRGGDEWLLSACLTFQALLSPPR